MTTRAGEKLLSANPVIGHASEFAGVRELAIARTPFSFIYRIAEDRIEFLRVWDARADRALMDVKV